MLRSLACALVVLAAAAQAQRTPAYQDGQVAARDALKAMFQGRYSRAGDAPGAACTRPALPTAMRPGCASTAL